MTKLLVWMKDSIELKLTDYTFEKMKSELIERKKALFLEVYFSMYNESARKLMLSLPAGMLREADSLHVNAGGYNVEVSTTDTIDGWHRSGDHPKYRVYHNLENRTNITKQSLINDLQTYAVGVKDYGDKTKEFRYKVRSAIKGFSTVKQFTEAFPDHETFLGKDFFGRTVVASTAITTTAQEVMCTVAKIRGEDRDGCCDGNPVI